VGRKKNLTPEQKELFKAIDEILWQDWDPINMKDNEGPRDEYESYVPPIFSLKIKGASAEEIALKLYEIESDRMGYTTAYEGCKVVAEKIKNIPYTPTDRSV
jgi:hypothetical protein